MKPFLYQAKGGPQWNPSKVGGEKGGLGKGRGGKGCEPIPSLYFPRAISKVLEREGPFSQLAPPFLLPLPQLSTHIPPTPRFVSPSGGAGWSPDSHQYQASASFTGPLGSRGAFTPLRAG